MKYDATIIIALWNRPDYLRELLEYFSRQSYDMKRVEMILIDDSGPEFYRNQKAVVDELAPKCPYPIKYFTTGLPKDIYGHTVARNIGLRNASSPLIIATDDDCLPHIDFVAEHIRSHEKNRRLMVAGVRVVDRAKLTQPLPVEIDDERSLRFLERQKRNDLGPGAFVGHNISVRKEHLDWAGGWNEKMCRPLEYGFTDRELGMRLLGWGLKFIINPRAIMHERPLEKRVTDFRAKNESRERAHKRFKRMQRIYKVKRALSAPLLLIPGVGRNIARKILLP
jgi:glycosyltransferase involved in cell wall biosynthesis